MGDDPLETRKGFVKRHGSSIHPRVSDAWEARLTKNIWPILLWLVFVPGFSAAQDDAVLPPGTYRLEMIMATVSRLPFLGTSKSASKSVSVVEVRREGTAITQSHQVCDFRVLEGVPMIKVIFSDKFVAALAKHSYPIQIEKDAQGWHYRADLG